MPQSLAIHCSSKLIAKKLNCSQYYFRGAALVFAHWLGSQRGWNGFFGWLQHGQDESEDNMNIWLDVGHHLDFLIYLLLLLVDILVKIMVRMILLVGVCILAKIMVRMILLVGGYLGQHNG